jgi:Transcription factor zinc-finger
MRLVNGAKEDIHFTERDLELLVREKMKKVEGTGDELCCPKCSGNLDTYTLYGFVLDRCPSCAGIWIDEGELEGVVSQINPRLASEFAGL